MSLFYESVDDWSDWVLRMKFDFQLTIARIVRCSINVKDAESSRLIHEKFVMSLEPSASLLNISYLEGEFCLFILDLQLILFAFSL